MKTLLEVVEIVLMIFAIACLIKLQAFIRGWIAARLEAAAQIAEADVNAISNTPRDQIPPVG